MCVCACGHSHVSYSEGAAGHVHLPPGDDDGVFNGFDRSVHTQEGAVSLVSDLDVDGAAFGVLGGYRSKSAPCHRAPCNINDVFL